jgi:plastocyanin
MADTPTPASRRRTAVPPPSGVRTRYLLVLLGGLTFLVLAVVVVVANMGNDDATDVAAPTSVAAGAAVESGAPSTDYETLEPEIAADGTITYTIPKGTRAKILAGEDIAVIPAKLELKVGQTLILKNDDTDAHIAGPFFVGPGESSTYTFTEPKVIEGDCTIHPSGQFEIDVVAA